MRLEPTNIQQIGNELAIQWNDGTESYLDLQFLRRACPCAACGGEPDVLGNIMRPNVSYSENSFDLVGFEGLSPALLQTGDRLESLMDRRRDQLDADCPLKHAADPIDPGVDRRAAEPGSRRHDR